MARWFAGRVTGGLLISIIAAELFLRFADEGIALKILAILLASLGVIAVGWRRLSLSTHLAANALFALLFAAYVGASTTRYVGLLKQWPQADTLTLLTFAAKWATVLFLAATVVTLASTGIGRVTHNRT